MILRRLWHGLDALKGPTVAAALLTALAASCGLNVGGLEAGTPGATSSGAAGGMSAATGATSGGGMGGADPGTGAGGAGGASSAGGVSSKTPIWHSFNVTVDAATGALSLPGDTPTTMPAATLTAYQASSPDDVMTKVDLTKYHPGDEIVDIEDVSWVVTAGPLSTYPYVGHSASERNETKETPEPLTALDLQVALEDGVEKSVFIAFVVPVDGSYTVKERAVHRIFTSGDPTVLLIHLKKQGASSAQVDTQLDAGVDQKWKEDSSPHDFTMPLTKGDQIIFEVSPKSNSFLDVIELAWTIEATVP